MLLFVYSVIIDLIFTSMCNPSGLAIWQQQNDKGSERMPQIWGDVIFAAGRRSFHRF